MSRMYFGVHRTLEAEADRIIAQSLKGVTKHSEKSDILTPWKQQERHRREVYTANGTPDPAIRLGLFGRVLNTRQVHLNSRDGIAPAMRVGSGLSDFMASQGVESFRPDGLFD